MVGRIKANIGSGKVTKEAIRNAASELKQRELKNIITSYNSDQVSRSLALAKQLNKVEDNGQYVGSVEEILKDALRSDSEFSQEVKCDALSKLCSDGSQYEYESTGDEVSARSADGDGNTIAVKITPTSRGLFKVEYVHGDGERYNDTYDSFDAMKKAAEDFLNKEEKYSSGSTSKQYKDYNREEKHKIGHSIETDARTSIRKTLGYKVGQTIKTNELLDKSKDMMDCLPNNSEISLNTWSQAFNTFSDSSGNTKYVNYIYRKDGNGKFSVTIENWSFDGQNKTKESSNSTNFDNSSDMDKHLQDSRKSNNFTDGMIHSTGSDLDVSDDSNFMYGYKCRLLNTSSANTCTPIDKYRNN